MVPSASAVAAALATTTGGLLLTTAARLLFATTRLLFFATAARLLFASARRVTAATTMTVEQAAVTAVAAAATAAEQAAVAAAATPAAVAAEGVCLRFETDQNDGHGRQSQSQLQYIALHQNTSKHMKKIGPIDRCCNCAMDDQRGPAIVLAMAALSRSSVCWTFGALRQLVTETVAFSYRRKRPRARDR